MDQLKPNFGNRSHLFYVRDENLAYASMWLLQSRQYQPLLCFFALLFPLVFFFFFIFYLPISLSYSFPLFSPPPRQIPSTLSVRLSTSHSFPSTYYFRHILPAFLPLVFYTVYHQIFCPSSPTS